MSRYEIAHLQKVLRAAITEKGVMEANVAITYATVKTLVSTYEEAIEDLGERCGLDIQPEFKIKLEDLKRDLDLD